MNFLSLRHNKHYVLYISQQTTLLTKEESKKTLMKCKFALNKALLHNYHLTRSCQNIKKLAILTGPNITLTQNGNTPTSVLIFDAHR